MTINKISLGLFLVIFSTLWFSTTVKAELYPAGSLFTCGQGKAVFYLSQGGSRYVFPNEATYFSWYRDFDSVVNISDEECSQYPLERNVTIKPGVYLVKLPSVPNVYAVEAPNVLRHLDSEDVAKRHYGDKWNDRGSDGSLRVISDIFLTSYVIGDPITNSSVYDRAAVLGGCQSIDKCYGEESGNIGVLPNPMPNIGRLSPYSIYNKTLLDKPLLSLSAYDLSFGLSVRRVSAAQGEYERHQGPRLQAFNKDNSMILLNADGQFVVRSANGLDVIALLPEDAVAPRWNPADKYEVYYFDPNTFDSGSTTKVMKMHVLTGVESVVYELPQIHETVNEDISFFELSRDGRYMAALTNHRGNDPDRSIIAIDLDHKSISMRLKLQDDLSSICDVEVNDPLWVAPSPLGNYLVVGWEDEGVDRFKTERCQGVEVYDINTGEYLGHVSSNRHNGDLGLDEQGREIYVTSYFGDNSDLLTSTLLPGSKEFEESYDNVLLNAGFGHISSVSCQGNAGVCVMTGSKTGSGPFSEEIYLVYTNSRYANGSNDEAKIRRIAHHRSSQCKYWHESQASMAVDGTEVIYASDWGDCGSPVDSYVIDLPPGMTSP